MFSYCAALRSNSCCKEPTITCVVTFIVTLVMMQCMQVHILPDSVPELILLCAHQIKSYWLQRQKYFGYHDQVCADHRCHPPLNPNRIQSRRAVRTSDTQWKYEVRRRHCLFSLKHCVKRWCRSSFSFSKLKSHKYIKRKSEQFDCTVARLVCGS